jgi:hypothetical protein
MKVGTETALYNQGYMDGFDDAEKGKDTPDYWDRLTHQYAGMAMQGLCANSKWDDSTWETMAEDAISAAHALVEKLKELEEKK